MSSKLLDKTVELLRNSDVPMTRIAARVGCTARTIQLLKGNTPHVPNVELCERLYEYLSGKQLEV